MATKCFVPFSGRRMRVTRVDNLGRPVYGSCASVATGGFVSVQVSAEIDEGEEVNVRTAGGELCASAAPCPQLKWLTVQMQFCRVDPDLMTMINPTFKKLSNYKGDTVGVAESYTYSCDEGIALEVWMDLSGYENDDRYAQGGWLYYLIPFITGGTVGDEEINNGALNLTLTGRTKKGSNWGIGPYNDVQLNPSPVPGGAPVPGPLLLPVGLDEPRRRFVTELRPPEAACGCQPLSNPDGPLVSINEDPTDPTRMSVSVQVGSEGVYRVDWGDGSAAQDVPVEGLTHRYSARGTYNVSVWATNDPTKITIRRMTVPFTGDVAPAVFVREDPADAVNRRSVIVTVDNHGNGAVVIDWGDATATTENDGTGTTESKHAYGVAGQYTLTATDKDNANAKSSVQLKVPFGLAKPTITVVRDTTDPTRQSVLVSVDNHAQGQVVIDWGDGGTNSTNAGDNVEQSNHRYTTAGDFTLTATDLTDASAKNSVAVTVPLPAPPGPVFTAERDPAVTNLMTAKINVTLEGGKTFQVQWNNAAPDDGWTDLAAATASFTYTTNGPKQISVRDKADVAAVTTHPVTIPFAAPAGPVFTTAEDTADTTRMTTQITVTAQAGKTFQVQWGIAAPDDPWVDLTENPVSHQYTTNGAKEIRVRDKADLAAVTMHEVPVPYTALLADSAAEPGEPDEPDEPTTSRSRRK